MALWQLYKEKRGCPHWEEQRRAKQGQGQCWALAQEGTDPGFDPSMTKSGVVMHAYVPVLRGEAKEDPEVKAMLRLHRFPGWCELQETLS